MPANRIEILKQKTLAIAADYCLHKQSGEQPRIFLMHRRDAPEQFFRVQYNPYRATRPHGTASHGSAARSACALCAPIAHALTGATRVALGDTGEYVIDVNPFPLGDGHLLVRAARHVAHGWLRARRQDSVDRFAGLLAAMVELQAALPDFVTWYSSPGAGATQPQHLHWHALRRPQGFLWPLEHAVHRAAADTPSTPHRICDYPIAFRHFVAPPGAVIQACMTWFTNWLRWHWNLAPMLAFNIVTTYAGNGAIGVYLVPRLRATETVPGIPGRIAGYELLGEIVLSDPAHLRLVLDGDIDYEYVYRALSRVQTPGLSTGECISLKQP